MTEIFFVSAQQKARLVHFLNFYTLSRNPLVLIPSSRVKTIPLILCLPITPGEAKVGCLVPSLVCLATIVVFCCGNWSSPFDTWEGFSSMCSLKHSGKTLLHQPLLFLCVEYGVDIHSKVNRETYSWIFAVNLWCKYHTAWELFLILSL